MQSNTRALREIFGQERRLLVLLFQRPYVWYATKHWEPLWLDITEVAERVLGGQTVKPHFLGALVLEALPMATGDMETRLVIDGQQRLTTTQLVLQAFHDACKGFPELVNYCKAIEKFTRNEDPLNPDPDAVFKVWPTNVDQIAFRQTMTAGTPIALRKTRGVAAGSESMGHQLADGYSFFHGAALKWLLPAEPGLEERVKALYETLRNRLRLVVIDLDGQEDDAQVIFETLNARGTPLLPADLIKNLLFHRARQEHQSLDGLYNQFWRNFDADEGGYWRGWTGRGHAKRARIDVFLQHYLSAKTRGEVAVGHLYTEFRDYVRGKEAAVTLAEIHRYATIYRGLDSLPKGSPEEGFLARQRVLEVGAALPFVLELFATQDLSVIRTVLADIDSFLVRRMICGLSTRSYNRFFVELLGAFEEEGDLAVRVRARLLAGDKAATRWPTDADLRMAWLETPIYERIQQVRLRMVLEALERELRTSKTEKLEFAQVLSIEHLLPIGWKEHWPLSEGTNIEEGTAHRNLLRHTFGNLTLLTQPLNSAVSNGPWKEKIAAVLDKSALCLNQQLGTVLIWDEEAIRVRGERLFKAARQIWPHP